MSTNISIERNFLWVGNTRVARTLVLRVVLDTTKHCGDGKRESVTKWNSFKEKIWLHGWNRHGCRRCLILPNRSTPRIESGRHEQRHPKKPSPVGSIRRDSERHKCGTRDFFERTRLDWRALPAWNSSKHGCCNERMWDVFHLDPIDDNRAVRRKNRRFPHHFYNRNIQITFFKAISMNCYLGTWEATTMPCIQTLRSTVKETAQSKIPIFIIRVSPETRRKQCNRFWSLSVESWRLIEIKTNVVHFSRIINKQK